MSAANEAVIGIAIIIYSLITSCLVLSLHTHLGENGLEKAIRYIELLDKYGQK